MKIINVLAERATKAVIQLLRREQNLKEEIKETEDKIERLTEKIEEAWGKDKRKYDDTVKLLNQAEDELAILGSRLRRLDV